MKTRREDNNDEDEALEFPDLKRQKKLDESSSPPTSLAFENALHTLASYDDDDEEKEEEEMKEAGGLRSREYNNRRVERNGQRDEEEEEDDDDDDPHEDANQARRSRMVEIRRDCPYLDTVNRQVQKSF